MSAFGWGLLASSSLLLGGVLALTLPITKRALGLIMAFGAGVLISAVAYDLVQEAQSKAAGSGRVAYGLFAGAITFFLGDAYVDTLFRVYEGRVPREADLVTYWHEKARAIPKASIPAEIAGSGRRDQ